MWMAEREIWRCKRGEHDHNYNSLRATISVCICYIVQCTSLSSATNGNMSCNSTGVSHYEDQCSFSCDPGYQLTGSSYS